MKKILLCLSISITSLFNVVPIQICASEIVSNQSIVQPQADIKEWKYKVINGHLCKRLWNSSQKRWETKWIPC